MTNKVKHTMKRYRAVEIATGRSWPIPAGGAEDDGGTGTGTQLPEVPEGYKLVTDEAWNNVKGAADRKVDADRIARENAALKAGIPGEVLESDRGQKLLASNLDNETVVETLKGLVPPKETQQQSGEGQGSEGQGQGENNGVQDPQLSEEERRQTQERQAAAQGATQRDDQSGVDPYAKANETFEAVLAKGGRRQDALGAAIAEVMSTDNPAVFTPEDSRWDPFSPEVGAGYER
jgi:hypothetical protein